MSDGDFEQLAEFLRSRRAAVRPEDVGLPVIGRRRRVPGLRREEVAQLAGVSVDYYIRLEQGRGRHVSESVLDAVARVLRLDPTERAHLRTLARPPKEPEAAESTEVRPEVHQLLGMVNGPAFVLGRCMDVLAWNGPAETLLAAAVAPGTRNMARHAFLDAEARAFYRDWPTVAAETVAYLRLDAARHPGDQRLAALVAELSAGSEEFHVLWAEHRVREKTYGRKALNHPRFGPMDFGFETLALPGDPDQLIVVYTAAPGTPEAELLAGLRD